MLTAVYRYDQPFSEFMFERFIEVGSSPTLAGMATQTLKAKYETVDDSVSCSRVISCHSKNAKGIYHQQEDEVEGPSGDEAPADPAAHAAQAIPAQAPTAPSGPAKELLSQLRTLLSKLSISSLPS